MKKEKSKPPWNDDSLIEITDERLDELLSRIEKADELEDEMVPMISLNHDIEERDRLIFGEAIDWKMVAGGMKRFLSITAETLQDLVTKQFADPGDKQNLAPTLASFLSFMKENPGKFLAHGYAISPDRSDYRVSIEGLVSAGKVTPGLTDRFVEFCRCPAELIAEKDRLYAWWD